jgi:hypothetical protein
MLAANRAKPDGNAVGWTIQQTAATTSSASASLSNLPNASERGSNPILAIQLWVKLSVMRPPISAMSRVVTPIGGGRTDVGQGVSSISPKLLDLFVA